MIVLFCISQKLRDSEKILKLPRDTDWLATVHSFTCEFVVAETRNLILENSEGGFHRTYEDPPMNSVLSRGITGS
jgi:hypothetical protein